MNFCGTGAMVARSRPERDGGSIPTVPLCKRDWIVARCSLDLMQSMVRRWHYAGGGSNTAVETFGLWRRDEFMDADCMGGTWWLPPTKLAALNVSDDWQGVLALSRLCCSPEAPKNAASFLLRHSMRQIDRERWPWFVTYADEGQGHEGRIYLASGWREAGFTKPERTYIRRGVMRSRKRGPKTLTHAEMLADGCELVGSFRRRRFVHHKDWP